MELVKPEILDYWFFILPIVTALLGWFGTWVAGKWLIYRVIPARKNELAEKIGTTVSSQFSFASIENKIADPDTIKKIMPLVEDHIDDFLRNKLKEKMPVVGMLIGDKTINSLKEVFLKEIEDLFPQVLKQFAGNLQSELDIKEMVSAKIKALTFPQLESVLSPIVRYFCIAGAITGLLIGLLEVLIIYFIRG